MKGFIFVKNGGELGIRTLDTLLGYTHFPGVLLRPLGQLSFFTGCKNKPFQQLKESFFRSAIKNRSGVSRGVQCNFFDGTSKYFSNFGTNNRQIT